MTPLLTYKHRIVAGIANMVVELHGKRLALLLEAIPNLRRIAALLPPDSGYSRTS